MIDQRTVIGYTLKLSPNQFSHKIKEVVGAYPSSISLSLFVVYSPVIERKGSKIMIMDSYLQSAYKNHVINFFFFQKSDFIFCTKGTCIIL